MSEVKIYTPKVAMFVNTNTIASPTFTRAGKGITSLSLAYNPQSTTEQYINQSSASTSVDAYQVGSDIPITCFAGEPLFEYLDNIRRNRYTGSSAETQVLIVYLYKDTPYPAELNAATIAINDFGGDAGSPVVINATVSFNGDPTLGTCTVAAGVPSFTPATVSAITATPVPANAATAIARASSQTITFNNPINTCSVVLITAAGALVANTQSWNANKTVLTIVPTSTMAAITLHIMSVTGVTDIYGQVLANVNYTFTTAS